MNEKCRLTRTASSFAIPVPDMSSSDDESSGEATRSQPLRRSSYFLSPSIGGAIPVLPKDGAVSKISAETLYNILNGEYDQHYDNVYILDCRYMYEYEAGHIKGAQHIESSDVIQREFYENPRKNSLIIFHCELSRNRGPQMAAAFREMDRRFNLANYPELTYKDTYVLDGGYRAFYSRYPTMCDGGYTKMRDAKHRTNGDLSRSTTSFRRSFRRYREMAKSLDNVSSLLSDGVDCVSTASGAKEVLSVVV